jgi:hypothetical protein
MLQASTRIVFGQLKSDEQIVRIQYVPIKGLEKGFFFVRTL